MKGKKGSRPINPNMPVKRSFFKAFPPGEGWVGLSIN